VPVVSMKQLLEAGVHFGHQTRRWNPKMKRYIFTERNGIHIIDLQKTVEGLEQAFDYARDLAATGEKMLFVGTKKQAQEAVRDEAQRAGQYYVNQRWLGGLLTNFKTIQERLRRLDELERLKESGDMDLRPKKEQLRLQDEMAKLNRLLGGIRTMRRLPAALFIVDCSKEHLAVHEAKRLGIPMVALVDTNADPDPISYPIPANDDAIRAVRLLAGKIADAAIEGQQMRESMLAERAAEEAELAEETAEDETYADTGIVASYAPDEEEAEPSVMDLADTPIAFTEAETAPTSQAEPDLTTLAEEAVEESSAPESVEEPAVEQPPVEDLSPATDEAIEMERELQPDPAEQGAEAPAATEVEAAEPAVPKRRATRSRKAAEAETEASAEAPASEETKDVDSSASAEADEEPTVEAEVNTEEQPEEA